MAHLEVFPIDNFLNPADNSSLQVSHILLLKVLFKNDLSHLIAEVILSVPYVSLQHPILVKGAR